MADQAWSTLGDVPRFDPAQLRRALIVRGLTERQAAQRAHVSRQTLRRALAGETLRAPSWAAIRRMLEQTPPIVSSDADDMLVSDEP